MSMFYKNFNTNTVQTFDVGKILIYLKVVSSVHQGCIYLPKNTVND